MTLATLLLTVILSTGIFVTPGFVLKALARVPFKWTNNPANTFAIIVSERGKSADEPVGGFINALHGVSGMRLNKTDINPQKWFFEPGEDPDHDTFLYSWLRIQDMGSIHYARRINVDRRKRFGTKAGDNVVELHEFNQEKQRQHVFYEGELTFVILEADTKDGLGINLKLEIKFARKFPVRSVLAMADPAAFLASLVEKIVNLETPKHNSLDYLGGDNTEAYRQALSDRIQSDARFKQQVEDAIGFEITSVSIREVTMRDDLRELQELAIKAEKKGAAEVITAQQDLLKAQQEKLARFARAEAKEREDMVPINVEASYFERVIKPAGENELVAAILMKTGENHAYRDNAHVTDFHPHHTDIHVTMPDGRRISRLIPGTELSPDLQEEIQRDGAAMAEFDKGYREAMGDQAGA